MEEEGVCCCSPYAARFTRRLLQRQFECRVLLVFEIQSGASFVFLYNHGFVSYPFPACRSFRNKPTADNLPIAAIICQQSCTKYLGNPFPDSR